MIRQIVAFLAFAVLTSLPSAATAQNNLSWFAMADYGPHAVGVIGAVGHTVGPVTVGGLADIYFPRAALDAPIIDAMAFLRWDSVAGTRWTITANGGVEVVPTNGEWFAAGFIVVTRRTPVAPLASVFFTIPFNGRGSAYAQARVGARARLFDHCAGLVYVEVPFHPVVQWPWTKKDETQIGVGLIFHD